MNRRNSLLESLRMWNEMPWAEPIWSTWTYTPLNVYNPETHEVVIKKDHLDKEITRKEEQLKHTEEIHRQQEERLREEISALKDQRKKREK